MLGIIIGNRGFFPAHLCESGRRDILRVLEEEGIKSIALPPDATRFGAVESLSDARKCADLFKAHRDGNSAMISVRDNGAGIPAAMLSRVFDMFQQLPASGATPKEGLGVGLSLARRLVELHGGKISAISRGAGQGSEFVVRLPLASPVAAATTRAPAAPAPIRPASRRMLVVDDNRDAAATLSLVVSSMGFDVQIAYDGPTALKTFEAQQPSVVLLDIGLGDMDGFEVARHIRNLPAGRDVVLIAVTGWGNERHRQQTHEAGFDHHLVKPVSIAALQAMLKAPGEDPHVSTMP